MAVISRSGDSRIPPSARIPDVSASRLQCNVSCRARLRIQSDTNLLDWAGRPGEVLEVFGKLGDTRALPPEVLAAVAGALRDELDYT